MHRLHGAFLGAILLCCTLLGGCQSVVWTPQDIRQQSIVTALYVADWAQTRNIARNPEQYDETSPVLGDSPSIAQVNRHFAGVIIGNAAIAMLLPESQRKWFRRISMGVESAAIYNNYSLGIQFDL